MSDQKAFLFYLRGVSLADVRDLAPSLLGKAALVELEPAPLIFPQGQYQQALSGRFPASSGFFDTLMPACHLPQRSNGYAIVEQESGREAAPRALPDILSTVGWSVHYQQATPTTLISVVQSMTGGQRTTPACNIVQLEGAESIAASSPAGKALASALESARAWAGEQGVVAVLSDGKAAPVQQFVNVNNFLADMGIIERDEESGQIIWENSLAYYAGHGQLWLNLMGRDPEGAVHPQEDLEETRDTLIKALPLKLRDASGAPVIERISTKDEVYSGDYLFCAPDLMVLFKPGFAPSARSTRIEFDETTFTTPPAGTVSDAGVNPATIKGFFLASGPALLSGATIAETPPLTSALPSFLHALGVEYSAVDSKAVAGLFQPAYLETHPIREIVHDQELSAEDEELVIERLRDLGYI